MEQHTVEHVRGMTLRELVLEVRTDVHGIKEELAGLKIDHEKVQDHESRLRAMEQRIYVIAASIVALGAAIAKQYTGVF